MSDERTEKATPKRRSQSKDEGQVSKSQDLNAAVTLGVSLAVLFMYSSFIMKRFKEVLTTSLSNLDPELVSSNNFFSYLGHYISETMVILLPIMTVMLIAGVAVNLAQVGPMLSFKAIQPKLSKLSPSKILAGFKRFFNLKSLVELVKSLLKTSIVAGIGYSVINKHKLELVALLGADMNVGMIMFSKIIFELVFQVCLILLILGIIDKKYQDYEYEKSIKMTKQEIKDERKNQEGDPKTKARIRNIQMKFAMQKMISAVPSASVVVTNPTHYAVALRYDTEKAPAPQVIAKGVDFNAFKIIEIAKANKIPVMENPPLARTLYKIVPLDGLIPAELYVAVAEVLAMVFKANKGV